MIPRKLNSQDYTFTDGSHGTQPEKYIALINKTVTLWTYIRALENDSNIDDRCDFIGPMGQLSLQVSDRLGQDGVLCTEFGH